MSEVPLLVQTLPVQSTAVRGTRVWAASVVHSKSCILWRGTSLIRNTHPEGLYISGWVFLMSEVAL